MSTTSTPKSQLGFDETSFSDSYRKSLIDEDDNTNKPNYQELMLVRRPNLDLIPVRVTCQGSGSLISDGSVLGRNRNELQVSIRSSKRSNSYGSGSGSGRVQNIHSCSPKFSTGGTRVGISAMSSTKNVLPTGNISPSGILKTGMMVKRSTKPNVLSFGTGNYGHGSIMRGSYYDKVISLSPLNAAHHCHRAAEFICMKKLNEAVKEYEQAIRLDPGCVRAHHHLGSLLIRLGQVESARKHLYFPGYQPDSKEVRKLQLVERHLNKCSYFRMVRDWSSILKESNAAITSGADACPQLFACKAEALLKLHKLDDADFILLNAPKFEALSSQSCSQVKFFGMLSEAYLLFVRAHIDMSLGRFERAISSIGKSGEIDPRNVEVAVLLQNIRSLSRAHTRGNYLFKSERFTEAYWAYGEALKYDPLNPIIHYNRAACWFKLKQYERSLDDCNQALLFYPNYTKALIQRAATYSKLKRWVESVKDYELLRRELPDNEDIAESLFHAQVALLKKLLEEEVYTMKFGGGVETIRNLEQFKVAVSSTGASVALFKTAPDLQCKQIPPFLDTIRARYPFINFLKKQGIKCSMISFFNVKIDSEKSPSIANVENETD